MQGIERLAELWFHWILAATWQLALLVCIVGLANVFARRASARLRHGLWLIVLLKVFLPPSLGTPFGVGSWGIEPLLKTAGALQVAALGLPATQSSPDAERTARSGTPAEGSAAVLVQSGASSAVSLATGLLLVWAAGFLVFWETVVGRSIHLIRLLRAAPVIDEGPIRVATEQIAMSLRLRRIPELLATDIISSPFLFGVVHPCIVLPKRLRTELDDDQWRAVLAHELVHWSRGDTWIGCLQVIAQSLFWFHPFVWWANAQLRHERECACDEAVLRIGQISPTEYGESIVRILMTSRGRSFTAASLVGVFEQGSNLQHRLEEIMNYEPGNSRFSWISGLALITFAMLFLPMAPQWSDSRRAEAEDTRQEAPKPELPKTPYPQIVETIPKIGATGVDADLKEIHVTFDRDMEQGMSWTGGPPNYPPGDKQRKAMWIDKRTCILPVVLEEASFYRAGINSTSYQNFRSAEGIPALPSVIYFMTKGTPDLRIQVPKVLRIDPANGATDLDPATQEVRVTFDIKMSEGMSWCGSGEGYPKSPKGLRASWSTDGRTCILPVVLKPNHEYQLGLNSLHHINFQSDSGVPLAPVDYKFRTRDGKTVGLAAAVEESEDAAQKAEPKSKVPQIVKTVPEIGAKDVDPATKVLKVTFDVRMGTGASWTGGGPRFPKIPAGMKPKWSEDGLTCTLPVILEPDHDYELGINSVSFKNFRSKAGIPVEPVIYRFHTRGAQTE